MDADRWRRVKGLCQEAAARDAAGRTAFLDQACADDADLRREVEALLATESEAEGFLTTPVWRLPVLEPGTRLGPYEILALIGAGGMGEVYKARDTRLDRTVALKILPPEVNTDSDRRARFAREAKTISQLSHPNICVLHDVGRLRAEGTSAGQGGEVEFLVMEYLDGTTLADRLRKGPLPLAVALELGAQIADALAAAHKHGVVHRDLKPANVMLVRNAGSSEATVKLLDFGLAKLKAGSGLSASGSGVAPGPGATASEPLTARGVILGTLAYMAPEQLEGKPADARTDLWALGAMLYEMLTGKPAFEGDSSASLIGAILEREPERLTARRPLTPPALERLVQKCLAKAQEDRRESAHDVADELRWIAGHDVAHPPVPAPTPRRRGWLGSAIVGLAVVGALAAWRFGLPGWTTNADPSTRAAAHVAVILPADAPLWLPPMGAGPSLALSPDGTIIAYTCVRDGGTQICLRRFDRREAIPVAGTEDGRYPAFSPDGRAVLFCVAPRESSVPFQHGSCQQGAPIKTLSVADGRVDTVGVLPEDLGVPNTLDWSSHGAVLLSGTGGIWTMSVPAGVAEPVWRTDRRRHEMFAQSAAWLPGGRMIIFGLGRRGEEREQLVHEIRALTVATGEERVLVENARRPWYLPPGRLLYERGVYPAAFHSTFDPTTLTVGPPEALPETPRVLGVWSSVVMSRNGSLLYLPAVESERVLTWVDRQARSVPALDARGPWQGPHVSPDGRRVAVDEPGRPGISIVDLQRGAVTRMTSEALGPAVWTPDGARITFGTPDLTSLCWQSWDGSGRPEVLYRGYDSFPGSWSPDGQTLLLSRGGGLLTLSKNSGAWKSELFIRPGRGGRFSPDGQWVVYSSDESGRSEVYVRAYPGADQRTKISVAGGHDAVWSPDGHELFYRNGDDFYVVAVTTGSRFSVGSPRLLFSGPYLDMGPNYHSYDVSADGQRLLVVQVNAEERAPRTLYLVQNWSEELKAKVGG